MAWFITLSWNMVPGESPVIYVALNTYVITNLLHYLICTSEKTPSLHRCLYVQAFVIIRDSIIPYYHRPTGWCTIFSAERKHDCVKTTLRRMMHARRPVVIAPLPPPNPSLSPRLIRQDHRRYGAIEFSSPWRRALNIHTVGRNRVPSVSRTRSFPRAPFQSCMR